VYSKDVHDLLIINLLEVSVIFIVYICLVFGENPIIKRGRDPIIMRGRDPINRFNPTTFLYLSQARTWISRVMYNYI
jgi:hypothetical protein